MADRGNGIRLFDSLDKLREILEELEGESDEEGEEDDEEAEGGMLSQLRHFVIQVSSCVCLKTCYMRV